VSVIKDQKEKNKISSVEELEVFKRSHQLTLEVYKITEKFPKSEKFGLISQMRRAAASIATIANDKIK
jgi:hypothetical protein